MIVLNEIQECRKVRHCWGYLNPIAYGPVVMTCRMQNPKVMIVTEQANLSRQSVNQEWDPTRMLIDYTTRIKQGQSGMVERIDKMFGGVFLDDFDAEKGSFNEFYWTHFIKCPGNFRKRGTFKTKSLSLSACAEKWLLEEISQLKPRLIVSFGAESSSWILAKIGYSKKWTERVWEEFKWIVKGERVPDVSVGNLKTKLIIALHPSGANPLALTFNKKLGDLVRTSYDEL